VNISLPKKDLTRLLARCQGIASRKSTIPMLANVLLSASGGTLHVSATDMFLLVTDSAPATVTEPGAVALPARELLARVAAMPDGPVQLKVSADGACTVKGDGARKFTLRTIPATEFPELPKPDAQSASVPVAAEDLATLIDLVHCSISADETRPHVNSALFEWEPGRMRMVSTDGHRLSRAEMRSDCDMTASMLVPLKAIGEIRKLLDGAGEDECVVMRPSGPHLFVEVGTCCFGVKLVDATFPPYKQVIPKKAGRTLRLPRKAFVDALSAVKLAANERTGGIRLTHVGESLRITSESPDAGNGFDEVAIESANGERSELTIGVNAAYLIESLQSVECDAVSLALMGELDPIVVTPVGEVAVEFLAVVMPMKV
jgi:DNA polymerase-3 subunit beta